MRCQLACPIMPDPYRSALPDALASTNNRLLGHAGSLTHPHEHPRTQTNTNEQKSTRARALTHAHNCTHADGTLRRVRGVRVPPQGHGAPSCGLPRARVGGGSAARTRRRRAREGRARVRRPVAISGDGRRAPRRCGRTGRDRRSADPNAHAWRYTHTHTNTHAHTRTRTHSHAPIYIHKSTPAPTVTH